MAEIELKQGEPFVLSGQVFEADEITPKPLTGVLIASQIRAKDEKLIADLTYTVIDNALGQYRLSADAGTLNWPAGLLYADIKETVSGVSGLSETLAIKVGRAVTRA